jgi:hypothetical protein
MENLGYTEQTQETDCLVQSKDGNSHCFPWESHKIHKYTLWTKSRWYIQLPLGFKWFNQLILAMEMCCVLFEVRTEFLNIMSDVFQASRDSCCQYVAMTITVNNCTINEKCQVTNYNRSHWWTSGTMHVTTEMKLHIEGLLRQKQCQISH